MPVRSDGGLAADATIGAVAALGASAAAIELRGPLGEGGMGTVSVGRQLALGRDVAVKTLRADVSARADARMRLLREAWISGALEHPNIVPIYDVGVRDGVPFVVMKRVEGTLWSDLVERDGAPTRLVDVGERLEFHLRVFAQVARAAHFAHTRGILHRDIKPDNVMVGPHGEVYLLDWGIAVQVTGEPDGRIPHAHEETGVAGTPAYMAPEMLGGAGGLNARTDVYLLGATLFHVLMGRPPHDAETQRAVLQKILASEPTFDAPVPEALRRIIRCAMRRDPGDRYPSVMTLVDDVESFLRHRGSMILSERADEHVRRLEVLARTPSSDDGARTEFATVLAECRFGYRAALEAWPENPRASDGLHRALHAAVRRALAIGDAAGAQAALAELVDPPPALAEAVRALRERVDAARRRARHIESEIDIGVGADARLWLVSLGGAAWVLGSLRHRLFEGGLAEATHAAVITGNAACLAGLAIGVALAKRALWRGHVNRRLMLFVGAAFATQILVSGAAVVAGLDVSRAAVFRITAWAAMSLYGAVAFTEPRLVLTVLLNVSCALAAAAFPERALDFVFANAAVVTASALLMLTFARRGTLIEWRYG